MDRVIRWLTLVFLGCFLVIHPTYASERMLTFAGPVGLVHEGQTFSVDVRFTNHAQTINALDITVRYPVGILAVEGIQRQQSAFTLWPEEPSWDAMAGTIHLVGGVPHGLYADNARVATILFSAKTAGSAELAYDPATQAFLNDGQGTMTTVDVVPLTVDVSSALVPGITVVSSTHPVSGTWYPLSTAVIDWVTSPETQYSYSFSADDQAVPDDVPEAAVGPLTYRDLADGRYSFTIKARPNNGSWSAITQYWVNVDATAPDPFGLEVLAQETIGGQSAIQWAATDGQSGIDYATLAVNGRDVGRVTSPTVLKTAWQGKRLTVTAYDYAGNTRSATLQTAADQTGLWWWIVGGVVVIAGAALGWSWHRRTR